MTGQGHGRQGTGVAWIPVSDPMIGNTQLLGGEGLLSCATDVTKGGGWREVELAKGGGWRWMKLSQVSSGFTMPRVFTTSISIRRSRALNFGKPGAAIDGK